MFPTFFSLDASEILRSKIDGTEVVSLLQGRFMVGKCMYHVCTVVHSSTMLIYICIYASKSQLRLETRENAVRRNLLKNTSTRLNLHGALFSAPSLFRDFKPLSCYRYGSPGISAFGCPGTCSSKLPTVLTGNIGVVLRPLFRGFQLLHLG
jgi:hypothetical protein